jgi:hypothetical protein
VPDGKVSVFSAAAELSSRARHETVFVLHTQSLHGKSKVSKAQLAAIFHKIPVI